MGFFGFLKEALVEERQKTKKTQGFFGFFMDSSYISSKHLTKKTKKPWVFLVFCLSSTKASFKKPKKPKVFLVFKNLNQKKTKKLKENQRKPSFDLKPKLLQKVLVFWFFGFLEDSSHIGRTLPLLVKLFCFNFFFLIQEKTMWRNLEKTKKPKLFGEVLVSGQKMFFFGFPWVFLFFFGLDS